MKVCDLTKSYPYLPSTFRPFKVCAKVFICKYGTTAQNYLFYIIYLVSVCKCTEHSTAFGNEFQVSKILINYIYHSVLYVYAV